MPTKIEKDEYSGTDTTGHEWDGIKELNTPLPRWWLYVFYATILFALLYWVATPAIPFGTGYTKGVFGLQRREQLQEDIDRARARQQVFIEAIEASSIEEIVADADLLTFAVAGGGSAFADNCAGCHALGGAGQANYPTLADDDWLWGGTLEDIHTTLLYGIRWEADDTRFSEMPAFNEILERDQIDDMVQYVLSLSDSEHDADAAGRATETFSEQCSSCHGEEGQGDQEQGAPRLSDQIWLYGSQPAEIAAQISRPQHGVMPGWEGRLDDSTIKMLTVYTHALGGGQ